MMKQAYKVKALFDGQAPKLRERVILLTEKGRVVDILPWEAEESLKAAQTELHDESDLYAMPGLIDGHVHLMLPGDGTAAEDVITRSPGEIQISAAKNAQQALEHGITTLRDCGGWPNIVFDLRRAIERGLIAGPDLLLCGSALTCTGGHAWTMGGEVDTVDELVKRVRLEHKQGADFVKMIATGGGTKNVLQHGIMLSQEQLNAGVTEAHRLGVYATAHVCTTATGRMAVAAGVDMIEHLLFADAANHLDFDPALAEEIARRGITVCHTMSVLPLSVARYDSLGRALTPAEQGEYDMLQRFNEVIFEGFSRTCDMIDYIPGTDAGWRRSPFGSLLDGMLVMAQLGMSNGRVLVSATGLAARVLGIAERAGVLAPGQQADFLLLRENPLADLHALRRPEAVYKKGVRSLLRVQ